MVAQYGELHRGLSLFIGSSREGADVARAIELQMRHDADVTVWSDAFRLGEGTLEALNSAITKSDFVVFVLRGDDLLDSRGEVLPSPRDNVLFELGLFMGGLGSTRTFMVQDSSQTVKLPSDLLGITQADYDGRRPDTNASLGPACTLIRDRIRELGRRVKLTSFALDYERVLRVGCEVSQFWANRKFTECFDHVRGIANVEQFEYLPIDHQSVMESLLGPAKAGYEISALSYNEVADWKDALLGARYQDLNADAVRNGASLERTFIYRNLQELGDLSPVLDKQKSERIKVRIADASRLDGAKGQLQNMLLVKTSDGRRYVVSPVHTPDGQLIKAVVSWNAANVDQHKGIYAVVRAVSELWAPKVKRRLLRPIARDPKHLRRLAVG